MTERRRSAEAALIVHGAERATAGRYRMAQ
jgi:hypothetical protein